MFGTTWKNKARGFVRSNHSAEPSFVEKVSRPLCFICQKSRCIIVVMAHLWVSHEPSAHVTHRNHAELLQFECQSFLGMGEIRNKGVLDHWKQSLRRLFSLHLFFQFMGAGKPFLFMSYLPSLLVAVFL